TGPQVWLSADRETWTWDLSDPLDWGHMADASDTPHGPVAVGFVRPADGINRAAVWFRDEGAWRQVLEAPHEPSELVGVAAGGGQVLAWGWRGTDRPHAATGDSILYGSDDGAEWSELRVPEEMRVLTAAYVGSEWLIGGYAVGKPAVWRSADLEDWEEIPTDETTYGWVVEHIDPGRRAITVVDLTGDSTPTRWVLRDGQTWERVTDVPDPRPLGLVGDETGGAKDGQLWVEDAGEWRLSRSKGGWRPCPAESRWDTPGDRGSRRSGCWTPHHPKRRCRQPMGPVGGRWSIWAPGGFSGLGRWPDDGWSAPSRGGGCSTARWCSRWTRPGTSLPSASDRSKTNGSPTRACTGRPTA